MGVVPSTSAKKALGTMKLHLIFILAVWSCAEWGRVDGQNPPTMPNFPSFDPRGAQHNHPQEDPADSSPPEEECCPCNHRENGHGHNSHYGGGYGYNSHNEGYGGYGSAVPLAVCGVGQRVDVVDAIAPTNLLHHQSRTPVHARRHFGIKLLKREVSLDTGLVERGVHVHAELGVLARHHPELPSLQYHHRPTLIRVDPNFLHLHILDGENWSIAHLERIDDVSFLSEDPQHASLVAGVKQRFSSHIEVVS